MDSNRSRWIAATALAAVAIAFGWGACNGSGPPNDIVAPPINDASDAKADGPYDARSEDGVAPEADATQDGKDGDANLWPDNRPGGSDGYDWLFDDAAWRPVTEITDIDIAVADVSKLAWPGFQWTSCGAACQVSNVGSGPLEIVINPRATSVRLIDGHWIGSFTVYYPFDKWATLILRADIDTNEVWGAVRLLTTSESAWGGMFGTDTARLCSAKHAGSGYGEHVCLLPERRGEPVTWSQPDLQYGPYREGFDFDDDWHWGAVLNHAAIMRAKQQGSTELELIYSGGGYIADRATAGSSLYWTECEDPTARVWGWKLGGEAKVLASGPWNAAMVAASRDRLAWIATQGTQYCDGGYDSADLYWSPRADDPANIQMHGPIPVPIFYYSPITVSSEWAAITKYPKNLGTAATILVVRLTDGKKWEIPARGPDYDNVVLSVREHELLTTETNLASGDMPWLVRYDLAKIDEIATALP